MAGESWHQGERLEVGFSTLALLLAVRKLAFQKPRKRSRHVATGWEDAQVVLIVRDDVQVFTHPHETARSAHVGRATWARGALEGEGSQACQLDGHPRYVNATSP